MHWLASVCNCTVVGAKALDDWLLGSLVQLIRANAILRNRMRKDDKEAYISDPRLRHGPDVLKETLELSIDRLQRVEDKARGTLIGVVVAVTIMSSATGVFGNNGPLHSHGCGVRALTATLLLSSIVFLLISGYLALRAYQIGRVYRPSLDDIAPIVTTAQQGCAFLFCIEQNYRVGTMRANKLSASFACLRNGLLLVAALCAVVVYVSV